MANLDAAATNGHAASEKFAEAMRSAILTGALAFLLFVVIVGIRVENAPAGNILIYRLPEALGLSLGAAVIRLLLDLFVWRKIPSGVSHSFVESKTFFFGLWVIYILGGVFMLRPSTREDLANAIVGLFTSPAWQSNARIAVELTELLTIGVFVIVSAMRLVQMVRIYVLPRLTRGKVKAPVTKDLRDEIRQSFPAAMLVIAVLLPVLVLGPQQSYSLDTAIQIVTYIMLGWGLNVVVGLAGLLDLGYVAFYAVGAYTYALLSTTFGWSFWVCLPLAGLFAALWGIVLGFPVLRLRGDYLAIVTMAFGEMIRIVLINWGSLTHGPQGIMRVPKLSFFGLSFNANDSVSFFSVFGLEFNPIYRTIFMYHVILAMALTVYVISQRLRRLPLGRAWEAMREDEIACRSLGINTVTTKLTAFAIGATFGGFAGSFFASRQGFISPESFTFQESAMVLAIVVLGGMGSQLGVAFAAIVLIGFSEFFRDLADYRMLIFGISMVVIMVWRPRGFVSSRTPSVALHEVRAISGSMVKEGAG